MIQNYNAEKITYKPMNLSFEEVTLLSKKEYFENKILIPRLEDGWWLQSPGYDDCRAAFVYGGSGRVNEYGFDIDEEFGVRPALKIQNCCDLIPGDKIRTCGYVFTILHGNLALSDICVGKYIFDFDANDFETSVIRKYLYNWAEEENGIVFKSLS